MLVAKVPDSARSSASVPPPVEERPRERMLRFGPSGLGDVELIALLLGGGGSLGRSARVLESLGGLTGLRGACPHELREIAGIGDAGATAMVAAVELGRRLDRLGLPWAESLQSPAAVASFVRAYLRGATQESFVCVGLDSRQCVRLVRTVAVGTLSHVEVHPRELFRPLVRAGMHSCVIAHNHPSGAVEPSSADIELTARMVEVGTLLGIPVLDHVVVTELDAVSLAKLGFLEH